MKGITADRYYTVPWFVELGDHRQVPGKAMQFTLMAALVCNLQPPMSYRARANLFFLEEGMLGHELCSHAVWLALELEMIEWFDDPTARVPA